MDPPKVELPSKLESRINKLVSKRKKKKGRDDTDAAATAAESPSSALLATTSASSAAAAPTGDDLPPPPLLTSAVPSGSADSVYPVVVSTEPGASAAAPPPPAGGSRPTTPNPAGGGGGGSEPEAKVGATTAEQGATAGETKAKRRSSRNRQPSEPAGFSNGPTVPNATLQDIGGVDAILEQLNELVGFPLAHPELFQYLGTEPISGILLHGPPGTGKTRLCHALAHALQVPFFALNAPEVVSGVSGDSEARLRSLFAEASAAAPALILLDEVDAIAGKRDDAGKAMEARIVAQLQTCMDDLSQLWKTKGKAVIVLGATNRPEVIEPALRRSGRFDREIGLGIPDLEGREAILRILTRSLRMCPEVDLRALALDTPGFVGSDLHAVIKESAMICMKEVRHHIVQRDPAKQADAAAAAAAAATAAGACDDTASEAAAEAVVAVPLLNRVPIPEDLDLEPLAMVRKGHFDLAVKRVQPSSMREGFSTIPDVTWDDVGALEEVRQEMDLWVQKAILFPELYKTMGLGQPAGLLLFGPPGCGKTLVAKAIAREASANFISVKGPELLNKYVGESERAVRLVFGRAKASSPCVLFFDELDALAPKRGMDRTNPGAERVVNQLLTEMDGVEGRKGVYVIAATNRVDMIDPAMIRPGRFDKVLYVPLPSESQRMSILSTLCRKTPLAPGVDLGKISVDPRCQGFSGADLKGVVREATMSAVRRVFLRNDTSVTSTLVDVADFEYALNTCKASVSEKDKLHYDLLWTKTTAQRGGGAPTGASASAAAVTAATAADASSSSPPAAKRPRKSAP